LVITFVVQKLASKMSSYTVNNLLQIKKELYSWEL